MPRNRCTELAHKSERDQLESLANVLPALARELHEKTTAPPLAPEPFIDEAKEHRRARIEEKRRHKPKRPNAASTDQP